MNRSIRDLFDELVRRRPLLVKAMLVLSSAALLATSEHEDEGEPEEGDHPVSFVLTGPTARVELTETTPSALFRFHVRALSLGVHDVVTTEGAIINVTGAVTRASVDPAVTEAVSVSVDANRFGADQPDVLTTVFNSFSTWENLEFTGDCATFAAADPCVAQVAIELVRADGGAGGGIVTVNVTPDFEMTAFTSEGTSGRVELPWAVVISTP
jgi:hypothetical protein